MRYHLSATPRRAEGRAGLFTMTVFAAVCTTACSSGPSQAVTAGAASPTPSSGSTGANGSSLDASIGASGAAASGGAGPSASSGGTTGAIGASGGPTAGSPSDAASSGSAAAASGGAGGAGGASSGTSGSSGGNGAPIDASSSGAFASGDAAPLPADGGLAGAAPLTGLLGTASRPLLSPGQAAEYTIANYLAQTGTLGSLVADSWNPTAGIDVSAVSPTYTVAATGGTQTTIQAAVAAAEAAAGAARVYIRIAPGTYTEQVCIKASAPPITLYGTSPDPTQTMIQFADYQGGIVQLGANPCGGDTNQQAATLDAFNAGFEAKNLTIANTVTTAMLGAATATQAVAFASTGDRVVLDNVRILSHQDTLYVDSPPNSVSRVYVKNSTIAGDVDFIFGAATAVFDGCTIEFVSDRHPSGGQPLAPDTDDRNAYGFLVIGSTITADASTGSGVVALGRAWDHSCTDVPTYVNTCVASGKYPNGQATIMNTTMDAHVARTAPWVAAATTKRPYSSTPSACVAGLATTACPANRFYEYANSGLGSSSGQ